MKVIRDFAGRVAAFEFYVFLVGVFSGLISDQFIAAALGVAVFFWITRWISTGHPFPRTSADHALCLLAFMALLTLWVSFRTEIARLQVMRLFLGIALFYATVTWGSTKRHLDWILNGIMFTSIALAVYAPFSVEWATGKLPFIPTGVYERFETLVQDSIHRNVMAGLLVFLLPITLGLLTFAYRECGESAASDHVPFSTARPWGLSF